MTRWHLPAFAGAAVALAVGFGASAAANRVVFAGWGLTAALVWVAVLRLGIVRRWSARARTGAGALTLAAALAALAPLLAAYGEPLRSGLQAIAPGLAPAVPGVTGAAVLAALAAAAGGGLLIAAGCPGAAAGGAR